MKTTYIILFLIIMGLLDANAQTSKANGGHFVGAQPIKPDTVYIIHEADLNRLYQLLSAGMQGVGSSDNFSVNQRKVYQSEFQKVDSVFRPQINKYHPYKKK